MNPLDAYASLTPLTWDKVRHLGPVGRKLREAGHDPQADECFNAAVKALLTLIEHKRINDALTLEADIYNYFVKTTETEDHYKACFDRWAPQLKALGYAHRKPLKPGNPSSVCFVIHNGVMLGHTQVLCSFLDAWEGLKVERQIYLAILGGIDPAFAKEMTARGVEIINKPNTPWGDGCFYIREQIAQKNINTAVWLGPPITASFALSMKLAPRQVLWSVKFHPVFFDPREVIVQPLGMVN